MFIVQLEGTKQFRIDGHVLFFFKEFFSPTFLSQDTFYIVKSFSTPPAIILQNDTFKPNNDNTSFI